MNSTKTQKALVSGLWVVDQLTDRMALVEITDPNPYGVTKILREIPTESSTTSGISYGDGSLWMAANGPDAQSGEILRVDPHTGATIERNSLPGGGATHGLDYDHYDPGTIWLSTLEQGTLSKVRISDWSVQHVVQLPHHSAHGIVRVEDGLWIVFKYEHLICKLDVADGSIVDQIEVGPEYPEMHGLTRHGDDLLYCDATSGWIVRIKDAL